MNNGAKIGIIMAIVVVLGGWAVYARQQAASPVAVVTQVAPSETTNTTAPMGDVQATPAQAANANVSNASLDADLLSVDKSMSRVDQASADADQSLKDTPIAQTE